MIQGRLKLVQAMTKSAEGVPSQARVKVVDTVDPQTIVVEALASDTRHTEN